MNTPDNIITISFYFFNTFCEGCLHKNKMDYKYNMMA